jgi:excisionase family DNA binding protein
LPDVARFSELGVLEDGPSKSLRADLFTNTFEQVSGPFPLRWVPKATEPSLVENVIRKVEEVESARSGATDQIPRLLLTVSEAARALSIGRSKCFELINSGRLRSVKIDGARRVPVTAVHAFVEQLDGNVAQ